MSLLSSIYERLRLRAGAGDAFPPLDELVPTIALPISAGAAENEYTAGGSAGAVVAQFSGFALSNPAGSGVVAQIAGIWVGADAATHVHFRINNPTALAVNTGIIRLSTGRPGVGRCDFQLGAAATIGGSAVSFLPIPAGETRRFTLLDGAWILPGVTLKLANNTANAALYGSLRWLEFQL